MGNVLDYDIIHKQVNFNFVIRFTFGSISLRKVWTFLTPPHPNYGLVPLLFFYKDGFEIKWLTKVDMLLKKSNQLLEGYFYY